MKSKRKYVQDLLHTKLGRKTLLPSGVVDELTNYLVVTEERYMGLRACVVKQLIFQLAMGKTCSILSY
jgi:hypothetical protein